jgi:hemolysin III
MRNETVQSETTVSFVGRWDASGAEKIADGVVHLIGIVAAISAGSILLALSFSSAGPGEYAAAVLYVAALLSVLSISFIYNMWPLTPAKWILRRFDHSMIYVLIAATYTPFLAQLPDQSSANLMLAALWIAAGAGIALKMLMPAGDRVLSSDRLEWTCGSAPTGRGAARNNHDADCRRRGRLYRRRHLLYLA